MKANQFLFFSIFCALAIVVHGQGQSGYISIDCGIPPYETPEDTMAKINYVSDEAFITTGVNFNVSEDYGALNNPVLPSTLAEVRAFPRGNRNCYTIKISQGKGNLYLIRAWFMYGNYDGKKALPEFDLYVNVNFWTSVKFKNASDQVTKEILSFAESDTIYVCLVNKGKGTPFISGLELRPVNSSIYGTGFGRNVSLVLYQRWDIGYLNGTGRYQDDRFDRIWSQYSSNISWNSIITTAYIDVFQNGYCPPDEVIKTAASPTNDDDPLELFWTSYDPNARFYAYLYFAELETIEQNETRKIKILWNGSPVSETSFEPSSKYSVTFSNPRAFTGKDHWISIQKTADSTLPPILNAIEIFTAQSLDEFYTITDDVKAIESIKATYKVNKIWSGDPCSPRLFPWEGIGCSYTNYNHQIKSLNLSSSGLQGPIVLAFRNLSLLESLDLSNNDLQQNIPEFLADLKHLKLLNLKGNNFTGFIPKSLMNKIKAGLLALSVDDQNLCNSRSCQDKKKNNMVVPIAIGTSVIILIVVLVVILIILRQRKKRAYSGPLLPSGKRRFTYNEVSSITNNFNKVIGKGGFGIVYLGSLEDGAKIAVKMINDPSLGKPKGSSTSSSSRASSQFQVEAELLLTVHHRNLASFVGYCDDDRSMALIYEYMANGNLQAYLSSENAEDLSWEKRLHIAIDSAQGLEYLHDGCRPAIVHRDVKTANILLNDNLEAKIADFGLSKVFPEDDLSHVVTTVMGTPGYVDPEYYRTFVLNEKSDVYSFGVVLLELITGQRAIIKTEEGDNISVIHYVWPFFEARELDGVVDPLLRGDFSEDSAWKFVDVAMSCVRDKGSNRPTMNQIVAELKQCLAAELAREPQSQ
ncbi:probable LRR receptor-like serine/threonine-protein kinase At4g29180 [Arabidopsis lyrata subsp. lyrata]|uniref:probable LRR receptor-like serine/threonine-protein kinase At4g29180 n=1 Tax=Arabidopsis lyrata subsp. lyrata TaxID=81972 RepID=UPI000A29C55C|nr:probable LRR receptor-like serine/threonine-protein kinase At4g29180 [Arabidopsis lyrata subsp. lyrata]|eukprot:XP_020873138.1 probable LRR receptor-like serine/threonine-protein kinase At4g29180 [Arabidopsis lyrata subsp. lyrata]